MVLFVTGSFVVPLFCSSQELYHHTDIQVLWLNGIPVWELSPGTKFGRTNAKSQKALTITTLVRAAPIQVGHGRSHLDCAHSSCEGTILFEYNRPTVIKSPLHRHFFNSCVCSVSIISLSHTVVTPKHRLYNHSFPFPRERRKVRQINDSKEVNIGNYVNYIINKYLTGI